MLSFSKFLDEAFKLTLKYHNKLNPKLWHSDQLDPKIVTLLVNNAYKFAQFSGVSRSKILDIVATGGNVNFNYTKFSDIDVHLMCNLDGMDTDALYDKKVKWTQSHADLKVSGYPIEFFCADGKQPQYPSGQGVYSILQNKWLIVPKHLDHVDVLTDPNVFAKIKYYIKYIRSHLLTSKGSLEEINKFKDKLHNMRVSGLQKGGEFSVENVIYKELRNRGLIDRLNSKVHAQDN